MIKMVSTQRHDINISGILWYTQTKRKLEEIIKWQKEITQQTEIDRSKGKNKIFKPPPLYFMRVMLYLLAKRSDVQVVVWFQFSAQKALSEWQRINTFFHFHLLYLNYFTFFTVNCVHRRRILLPLFRTRRRV